MEKEENSQIELKDKLHLCQKENLLLREEIKNKTKKAIETILNQNNELLKFNY